MNRTQTITELKQYFSIEELVCDHVYKRFGERAWMFFSDSYFQTLLVVRRDILKAPMTCNDKTHHQRGIRCNLCELVKGKTTNYMSAHVLALAGDFDVKGMTAAEARKKIIEKKNLLPCNIRMEDEVTWLHLDVMAYDKTDKVTLFKA